MTHVANSIVASAKLEVNQDYGNSARGFRLRPKPQVIDRTRQLRAHGLMVYADGTGVQARVNSQVNGQGSRVNGQDHGVWAGMPGPAALQASA
jgi:hypothetical protein